MASESQRLTGTQGQPLTETEGQPLTGTLTNDPRLSCSDLLKRVVLWLHLVCFITGSGVEYFSIARPLSSMFELNPLWALGSVAAMIVTVFAFNGFVYGVMGIVMMDLVAVCSVVRLVLLHSLNPQCANVAIAFFAVTILLGIPSALIARQIRLAIDSREENDKWHVVPPRIHWIALCHEVGAVAGMIWNYLEWNYGQSSSGFSDDLVIGLAMLDAMLWFLIAFAPMGALTCMLLAAQAPNRGKLRNRHAMVMMIVSCLLLVTTSFAAAGITIVGIVFLISATLISEILWLWCGILCAILLFSGALGLFLTINGVRKMVERDAAAAIAQDEDIDGKHDVQYHAGALELHNLPSNNVK